MAKKPLPQVLTALGLEIEVRRSEIDGVLVVEIDGPADKDLGPDGAPRIRVYLNGEAIHENPPFPEEI